MPLHIPIHRTDTSYRVQFSADRRTSSTLSPTNGCQEGLNLESLSLAPPFNYLCVVNALLSVTIEFYFLQFYMKRFSEQASWWAVFLSLRITILRLIYIAVCQELIAFYCWIVFCWICHNLLSIHLLQTYFFLYITNKSPVCACICLYIKIIFVFHG